MVKSISKLKEQSRIAREEAEARKLRGNNRGKYVHTKEQAQKIKATQMNRVAQGIHNRAVQDTCYRCGFTGQKLMIDRWHNDNCKELVSRTTIKEWSYISPKLRGLKVKT